MEDVMEAGFIEGSVGVLMPLLRRGLWKLYQTTKI